MTYNDPHKDALRELRLIVRLCGWALFMAAMLGQLAFLIYLRWAA